MKYTTLIAALLLAVFAQARPKVKSFLEIIDVTTGECVNVKEFHYLIEAPNWTQDGKWLIYNHGGRIFRIAAKANQTSFSLIPTGKIQACNNDHVLSPDRKQIAISSGSEENKASRIYTLPVDGGEPTLVTPNGPSYLHGWSIDGKTLLYAAPRNGNFDIYTIPVTGGKEQRLTKNKKLDDGPEYSPDGKYIWFNSERSGLMQIWRMDTNGKQKKQITNDPKRNSWFPHVSPDGKQVVFVAYKKGDLEPHQHLANKHVELRIMTSEGKNVRTLCPLFGGQGTINVNSWSPDSRHVAFVRYELQ